MYTCIECLFDLIQDLEGFIQKINSLINSSNNFDYYSTQINHYQDTLKLLSISRQAITNQLKDKLKESNIINLENIQLLRVIYPSTRHVWTRGYGFTSELKILKI